MCQLFNLHLLTKFFVFSSETKYSLFPFSISGKYLLKKITTHVSCAGRVMGGISGEKIDQNGVSYLMSQNCLKLTLVCLPATQICTQVLHFIG